MTREPWKKFIFHSLQTYTECNIDCVNECYSFKAYDWNHGFPLDALKICLQSESGQRMLQYKHYNCIFGHNLCTTIEQHKFHQVYHQKNPLTEQKVVRVVFYVHVG